LLAIQRVQTFWLSVASRQGDAGSQYEFLIAIGTFYRAVFQFEEDFRMAERTAPAIAGYGCFFDFNGLGGFGRLRHGGLPLSSVDRSFAQMILKPGAP